MEYEDWAKKLWPAPYGGVVNTQFDDSYTQVVNYSDLQDSTIWTGAYLAAEAFRYAATGDPEAKENAARAVRTLHFFLRVTNKPGYLARFAGPLTAPYLGYLGGSCSTQAKQPCYSFTGSDGQPAFWLGGTTRDQYTGWFFGMGVAYRLIDDPDLRAMIRADVKEVIKNLESWDYKIQGPPGSPFHSGMDVLPSMQLAWHLVAADILRDHPAYCRRYEERVKKVLPLALADNYSGLNKYMQYYGFNLDFMNNYSLILREPNAERRKAYLGAFRDGAYRFVRGTGNTFYDFIYMAVSGETDAETLERDRESLGMFQDAPNVMRCVQPPPSRLSRISVALFRIEKFLARFGLKQEEIFPQAAAPYPLDQRCPVDFIWQQSPYLICCFKDCAPGQATPPGCSTQFQLNLLFPGTDYLVAYWLGRYHGFLGPED